MPKMIDRTKLDALKAKLADLPSKEKTKISSRDAVSEMAEDFRAILAKNYSIEDIYAMFKDATASDISLATFRGYFNKEAAARNEVNAGKTRRKTAKPQRPTNVDRPGGEGNLVAKDGVDLAADEGREIESESGRQSEVTTASVSQGADGVAHDAISEPQKKPLDSPQGSETTNQEFDGTAAPRNEQDTPVTDFLHRTSQEPGDQASARRTTS
ncbi:hypothetical protein SAMN05428995_1183 [Loktanella sp. DSM 29012]|uniref:hypothetical protein n=1 Tax=Loktanella sp. DSM 29012 TaxID=1881056 RepID=UPI0008B7ED14|nr:hypothetical protein [Loktanella sp. DSM 29012]SEQ89416.1 hypothetical protein SAMN05428995_1183 [Loktanella sp. DSM 29012]